MGFRNPRITTVTFHLPLKPFGKFFQFNFPWILFEIRIKIGSTLCRVCALGARSVADPLRAQSMKTRSNSFGRRSIAPSPVLQHFECCIAWLAAAAILLSCFMFCRVCLILITSHWAVWPRNELLFWMNWWYVYTNCYGFGRSVSACAVSQCHRGNVKSGLRNQRPSDASWIFFVP